MKKAFTLLELVFAIVVIGILAATIIPSTNTNSSAEAATQLASHIRYTQHLAMMDDKYRASSTWFRDRWQIRFDGNKYSLAHDNNTKFAKDPQSAKELKAIDLEAKYSVELEFTGSCSANAILSFDYLGRPLLGSLSADTLPYPQNRIMTTACNIKLTSGSESSIITITPETGYTKIQ